MPSLAILVSAVLVLSCGQNHRQKDRITQRGGLRAWVIIITRDNDYSAVIWHKSFREFTRFIWWMLNSVKRLSTPDHWDQAKPTWAVSPPVGRYCLHSQSQLIDINATCVVIVFKCAFVILIKITYLLTYLLIICEYVNYGKYLSPPKHVFM